MVGGLVRLLSIQLRNFAPLDCVGHVIGVAEMHSKILGTALPKDYWMVDSMWQYVICRHAAHGIWSSEHVEVPTLQVGAPGESIQDGK